MTKYRFGYCANIFFYINDAFLASDTDEANYGTLDLYGNGDGTITAEYPVYFAEHLCVVALPFGQADLAAVQRVGEQRLATQVTTGSADLVDRLAVDRCPNEQLMGEGRKPDLTRLTDDLWQWFASPNFVAISRLLAESSADAELRAAIQPIVAQHRLNTHALIERIFPKAHQGILRTAAHAVILLMQGMATERHLVGGDDIERDILQVVRDFTALIALQGNAIIPDSISGGK